MSTPPRQLKITYGTTAVGGTLSSSTLTLHGAHSLSMTADDFTLTYQVLLTATTEAIFQDGVEAFEAAMTTRRQAILVQTLDTSGSVDQTLLTLSHTGNTALNIAPEFGKPGGEADTNLSRLYEVTITGGLPTKTALAGLQTFDYDVTFSPSRRAELTVRGTYTAVASVQARAQYLASIAARVSSITTALSGTWELVDETYTPDDTDQIVTFTRVYRELIFAQGASGTDVATIVDQQLSIKSDRLGSEGLRDERKLATITATYSAGVDKTVTTDLATVWIDTIRPWIVQNIQTVAGDRLAIVAQGVDYDWAENRINATMTANARAGGDTLALTLTEVSDIDMGKIFARTWPTSIPDKLTATDSYVYQGPKTIQKTFTSTTTKLGSGAAVAISAKAAGGGGGGGRQAWVAGRLGGQMTGATLSYPSQEQVNKDWNTGKAIRGGGGGSTGGGGGSSAPDTSGGILVRFSETLENRSIGLVGEQIDLHDKTTVEVYEYINAITGTGGGGGGGGKPGRTTT